METLKSSDSPRVIAEKIKKNLDLSEKGYKYHFDVKPPANPDEKTLWIDLFVKTILKEIDTKTYADEYFASHPSINRSAFKYIGDDGKPTLEFKKMIYGDDYDPDVKYILQPKNNTINEFCKPIETQTGIQPYNLDEIVFNTKSVKSFSGLFGTIPHIASIDTSKWDTSNVASMEYMCYYAEALKKLDVSKWDTSKVNTMFHAFNSCSKLKKLDVSKWNTSKVETLSGTFTYCSGLTELDVSKWNTSKVTEMNYMFNGCSSLKKLDVSNWDTSKVTNMEKMFYQASNLTTITGTLDFRVCTNYKDMFTGCDKLTMVKVKNLPTDIDTFCSVAKIDKSKVIVVA